MSPHDDALTLREYDATEGEVKVELDMLKLAEHILKSKVADFDQSQFVDHHEEAVVEMLKKKQAVLSVSPEQAAPLTNTFRNQSSTASSTVSF